MQKSLRDRAVEMSVGCECMLNREKGDMEKLQGEIVTIIDFDFMTDSTKNLPYVVFTIQEDDTHFYFGGTVLTDKMSKLAAEGYTEDIQQNGLPVIFGKQQPKDKKKQAYTTVTFYPEVKTVDSEVAQSTDTKSPTKKK